jgi:hypothetical protein
MAIRPLTCSHGSRFADHYDDFLQPMLLSAHPLAQSNYGDNTCPPGFGNDNSEAIASSTSEICTHACRSQCHRVRPFDLSLGKCDSAASPSISTFINWHQRIYFYSSSSSAHYQHYSASPNNGFLFLYLLQFLFFFFHNLHHLS